MEPSTREEQRAFYTDAGQALWQTDTADEAMAILHSCMAKIGLASNKFKIKLYTKRVFRWFKHAERLKLAQQLDALPLLAKRLVPGWRRALGQLMLEYMICADFEGEPFTVDEIHTLDLYARSSKKDIKDAIDDTIETFYHYYPPTDRAWGSVVDVLALRNALCVRTPPDF